MAGLPDFECTGEVFLPGLAQLGHEVGVLRGEPVLKLVERLHRREHRRGNFESSRFHDGAESTTKAGMGKRAVASGECFSFVTKLKTSQRDP